MIRRFLTILGLAASAGGSITDCGSSFQITSLGLYPDPPVRNQPLYMDLQFTNTGPAISDGTVYTSLTYNGLPIAVDPKPLCQDTPCPIPQGYNNRSTATTCPDVTGKVTSQIKWQSPTGTVLLCIQTVLKVGSTPVIRGSYHDSSTTGSYYEATDDTTGSSADLAPVKDLVVWQAPMCLAPTVPYGPELAAEQSAPHDESPRLRVGLTLRGLSSFRAHRNE